MTAVLVTGPIGGGKSAVCRRIAEKGWPVYSCDERCKALYDEIPLLRQRIEEELGIPFGELRRIFTEPALREKLEALVYPLLIRDLESWKAAQTSELVFIESAIALSKPVFDGQYDKVLLVTAPREIRQARNPEVSRRDHLQSFDLSKADRVIENTGTLRGLNRKTDNYLKQLI